MTYEMKNERLNKWVQEVTELCQPDRVDWCDGSKEEYDRQMANMVAEDRVIPLKKRPNCFLVRSDPGDVARERSIRPTAQVRDVHRDPSPRLEYARALGEDVAQHLEILEVRRGNPVLAELELVLLAREVGR